MREDMTSSNLTTNSLQEVSELIKLKKSPCLNIFLKDRPACPKTLKRISRLTKSLEQNSYILISKIKKKQLKKTYAVMNAGMLIYQLSIINKLRFSMPINSLIPLTTEQVQRIYSGIDQIIELVFDTALIQTKNDRKELYSFFIQEFLKPIHSTSRINKALMARLDYSINHFINGIATKEGRNLRKRRALDLLLRRWNSLIKMTRGQY